MATTENMSNPYIKEWETLCNCSCLQSIQQLALESKTGLSNSKFRSVCWRILLNIFPIESSKWLSLIRNRREGYESLRHQYMIAPDDSVSDPNVNNPLSTDEESSWNQYFEDSETKRIIKQDVTRTFPECPFFHSQRIQDMMVSILFCYARKYPHICYIQGMHEVLAILAYIINVDHQNFVAASQDSSNLPLLQELMDQTYLEHDSYVIFEAVMMKLYHWYEDGQPRSVVAHPTVKLKDAQPFQKYQDTGNHTETKIVKRLNAVQNDLLKRLQPDLHEYLTKIEILPQVYGIRWARLMFGRELQFSDVHIVWDAILADSYPKFLLIEYIMVALLTNIKDKLMSMDQNSCYTLLMKYPDITNVHQIIRIALHFREPLIYSLSSSGETAALRRPTRNPGHISVSRSTSLPRAQQNLFNFRRPNSVDLAGHSENGGKTQQIRYDARSYTDPLRVVSLSSPIKSFISPTKNPVNKSAIEALTSRGSVEGQVLREMKVRYKSTPIRSPNHPRNSDSSSSDENLDPSFPKKDPGTPRRRSSGGNPVVSPRHSTLLLENFDCLQNRLKDLNLHQDMNIRTCISNMKEALEVLFDYKPLMASPQSPPPMRNSPVPKHPLMVDSSDSDEVYPILK